MARKTYAIRPIAALALVLSVAACQKTGVAPSLPKDKPETEVAKTPETELAAGKYHCWLQLHHLYPVIR